MDHWDPRAWAADTLRTEQIRSETLEIYMEEERQEAPLQVLYGIDPEHTVLLADKLRINRKSLAAEARINRALARKRRGDVKYALDWHRKNRLRQEARAAHLAWGWLRGVPYRTMEVEGSSTPPLTAMAKKLGRLGVEATGLREWVDQT